MKYSYSYFIEHVSHDVLTLYQPFQHDGFLYNIL